MKKVIAAVLALVLCLSLAACNSGPSMEEYMQEHQTEYKAMAQSMSTNGVTMEFSARDDSLVLSARLDMAVDESVRVAAATVMEVSLEDSKQDYLSILDAVREAVPSAKSIIVEFYDSEDTLIISKEFFAE